MAKFEMHLQGDFDTLLQVCDQEILGRSASASFEDGSDYALGDTRIAVRVYERYSVVGGNRLSMSLTLLQNEEDLYLCAITSGGSNALFWKINTFGETSFLDNFVLSLENYLKDNDDFIVIDDLNE